MKKNKKTGHDDSANLRKREEEALQRAHDQLEQLVAERTENLSRTNEALRKEIAERKQAEEALRESEERYHRLVESAPEVIYNLSAEDGTITLMNPAFERITGWSRAEWLGKPFMPLVHPDDLTLATETFKHVSRGEPAPPYELRILSKSGEYLLGEFVSFPHIVKRKVIGEFGIARDITEHKRAQEALRESEEKYRNLVERANDGIVIVQDGIIKYINARLAEMRGVTVEEVLNTPFTDHIYPDELPGVVDRYKQRMAGEDVSPIYETALRRRDGDKIPAELNAGIVTYQGKPADLVIIRDITERKRAEEAVIKSEEKFRSLTENVNLGIYRNTVGPEGKFIEANPAIIEIFGYKSKEEFLAINVSDLYQNPENRNKFNDKMLKEGFVRGEELWLKKKDGNPFIGSVSAVEVKDEQGYVKYYDGIIEDITDRKQAEEALRESEEKWRSLVSVLPDYVSLLDREGRFLFLNQYAEGFTEKEVIGSSVYQYLSTQSKEIFKKEIAECQNTQKIRKFEHTAMGDHGIMREYEDYLIPILDKNKATSILVISRDISERKRAEEALKKSEEYFRALTENSSDIIIILDKNGTITYTSPSIERFTGYRQEELIGKSGFDFIMPVDLSRAIYDFGKAILTKATVIPNSFRVRHKDGSERILEGLGKNLLDDSIVAGFVMNCRDVTERSREEEALCQAEENFRHSLDNLPLGVRIITEEGETIYANQAILDIYGFSRLEELRTTPVKKRYTPESYTEHQKRYERRQRGEDLPSEYEISIVRKDGEVRHLLVSRKELFWSGKKQYQMLYRDITERKRAEEELRKSEARFRSYFNMPMHGIAITSTDKGWIEVNDRICSILGYTREELFHKSWAELTHPADLAADTEQFNRLLYGQIEQYAMDKRFIRKDGGVIWTNITVGCVRKSDGNVDYIIGLMEDITQRKQAEEALRESESRLRALSLELSFVEERERKRLASYLHDEIGQSLALLRMKFGSLAGVWESRSGKRNIQQIRDLLEKVIDQTHTLTFELSPPILHQLGLEAAIEWAGEKISQDFGIEFMFSDDGMIKPLSADIKALLFRCARELMSNTVKHAKAKRMTVSLTRREERIFVVVEDDGVGIDMSLPGRHPYKVGFGLFSVRERLGAVGGSYEFQSEPGRGTRITLSVPLKEEMPSS